MTGFKLHNEQTTVEVDPIGGAIVSFTLNRNGVNPLNFRLQRAADTNSAFFQGHFVCLPRWGDPSAGEARKGLIKHGDFSTLEWTFHQHTPLLLDGKVTSAAEEMSLNRWMFLDSKQPVLHVTERVKNISSFWRMGNFVQHPSIAAPFLDADTIVNSNAVNGFTNLQESVDSLPFSTWPLAYTTESNTCDMQTSSGDCSGVYSYTIAEEDRYGWITAYSPKDKLLIGYIWKRSDYPWVNCWIHSGEEGIRYRGLEFGTTGIHQSIDKIHAAGYTKLFNEPTVMVMDAGDQRYFAYTAFLLEPPAGFKGMQTMHIGREGIMYKAIGDHTEQLLPTPLTEYYEQTA